MLDLLLLSARNVATGNATRFDRAMLIGGGAFLLVIASAFLFIASLPF
jgi:hypothetical protein